MHGMDIAQLKPLEQIAIQAIRGRIIKTYSILSSKCITLTNPEEHKMEGCKICATIEAAATTTQVDDKRNDCECAHMDPVHIAKKNETTSTQVEDEGTGCTRAESTAPEERKDCIEVNPIQAVHKKNFVLDSSVCIFCHLHEFVCAYNAVLIY